MEAVQVVRVVGTALCLTGLVLCWKLRRTRFGTLTTGKTVSVGVAALSAVAFWKLLAFGALVVVPAATVGVANYHTFEGVHEVNACARCHVMRPMVNDMRDPASDTLAARHYKYHYIPRDQCYNCHSDYGLSGDLQAKMEGFRHLARYTTHTYAEPIKHRGNFNNANCFKCHEGAPRFEAVSSHQTVRARLSDSSMSCLNCHGWAHPSREQRTPGSADYERLMRPCHE